MHQCFWFVLFDINTKSSLGNVYKRILRFKGSRGFGFDDALQNKGRVEKSEIFTTFFMNNIQSKKSDDLSGKKNTLYIMTVVYFKLQRVLNVQADAISVSLCFFCDIQKNLLLV